MYITSIGSIEVPGADVLYIVLAKVVVEPSQIITVTARVKFRHRRPCPFSDWKITFNCSSDMEVVDEDKT